MSTKFSFVEIAISHFRGYKAIANLEIPVLCIILVTYNSSNHSEKMLTFVSHLRLSML